MKATILPLLALLTLPLSAQETPPAKPEPAPAVEAADSSAQHEADLSFQFTLKPADGEATRSTLFADQLHTDTRGTVVLPSQAFGHLQAKVNLSEPSDDPRYLIVTVRGSGRRLVPDKEGDDIADFARAELLYRGPGTYRIAVVNGHLLTVTVKEKPAK